MLGYFNHSIVRVMYLLGEKVGENLRMTYNVVKSQIRDNEQK